ncbi:MAG: hypothetical protein V4477_22960 [Pseudomonadota bacterium]
MTDCPTTRARQGPDAVEAYTAPWRAIAARIQNKRDLSAKPDRIPRHGMVKQSLFRLLVFVSTIPASVTTQRGVTPSTGILSYRESNGGHGDGLFCSQLRNE